MATVLNPQSNIWQALGQGLGSGLEQLAQGKIQQIQQKQNASAYKKMGYPEEIAQLPQGLQALAIKNFDKQREELYKQQAEKQKLALDEQNKMEKFRGDLLLAKRLGATNNDIQAIMQLGPDAGSMWLSGVIKALQKEENPKVYCNG